MDVNSQLTKEIAVNTEFQQVIGSQDDGDINRETKLHSFSVKLSRSAAQRESPLSKMPSKNFWMLMAERFLPEPPRCQRQSGGIRNAVDRILFVRRKS